MWVLVCNHSTKLQAFPTLAVCGSEITILSIVIGLKCSVACVSMAQFRIRCLLTHTHIHVRAHVFSSMQWKNMVSRIVSCLPGYLCLIQFHYALLTCKAAKWHHLKRGQSVQHMLVICSCYVSYLTTLHQLEKFSIGRRDAIFM